MARRYPTEKYHQKIFPIVYCTAQVFGNQHAKDRLDKHGILWGRDYSFFGSLGESMFTAVAPGAPQLVFVSPSPIQRVRVPKLAADLQSRNDRAVIVFLDEQPHLGAVATSPEEKWLTIETEAGGLIPTLAQRFLEGANTREVLRQFIPVTGLPNSTRLDVVRV